MLSRSAEETLEIGRIIGQNIRTGAVLALFGDLGSGKTVLIKGIGIGLDVQERITSPSFTIMNIYSGKILIYHFDFYRLDSILQLQDLGLDEFMYGDGITAIEWAERLGDQLPTDAIRIFLKRVSVENDSLRRIEIATNEKLSAKLGKFTEN